MIEQEIVISNRLGLHARAAAKLVHMASDFCCDVIIKTNGEEIDAKSILGLLGLGAAQGTQVAIACDGEDEEDALAAVTGLIGDHFGEGG